MGKARRLIFAVFVSALMMVAMAAPALAFHHGGLPSTECSADAAGDPSNENGQAREALSAHNPNGLPLAPVDTPGEGQGEGDEHCANAESEG